MPLRNLVLTTNEIYHVFNRSIAKENVFSSKINLRKALEVIHYYRLPQRIRLSKFKALPANLKTEYLAEMERIKPLVEIYTFALMPNHHHFLLKQLQDKGITRFVSNFQNSFAKIYNLKNDRSGGLFQNSFKARRAETDEEFLHVSRYIHLNPVTSYVIEFEQLAAYPWTSFSSYVNEDGSKTISSSFINTDFLLRMIGSSEKYVKFTSDQIDYQRNLVLIKDLIME